MAIPLNQVLEHPHQAAESVSDANPYWRCAVMLATPTLCGFALASRPMKPFSREAFPVEVQTTRSKHRSPTQACAILCSDCEA